MTSKLSKDDKRVRIFLKDTPRLLKRSFPVVVNAHITFHEQAVYLDEMTEMRNKTFHALSFAALDSMMNRAARVV